MAAGRRTWTLITVGLVLLSTVPSIQGFHLSAGSQDAVLLQPREAPGDPDTEASLYERGIQTDCPDPDDLTGDPFCGKLIYHAGTELAQASPPDQHVPMTGWTFDVVASQYVGTYGLGTCYPWCAPGGVIAYETVDGTLHETFPGIFTASHEDESNPNHQSYAVDLRMPNAIQVAQTAAGSGSGSGWLLPTTDPTFVGFLYDEAGTRVDQATLSGTIEDLIQAEQLPESAQATVCGFSASLDEAGPTREAPLTDTVTTACDVLFTWRSEGTDSDFGPSGDERCDSAAYVCGTMTPAWYGQLACKGWAGCQAAHETGDAWHSTPDHDVWHHVVAPTLSDCGGLQDPGFLIEPFAPMPYIAHDLDIYTPPTSDVTPVAPGDQTEATLEPLTTPATQAVDPNDQIDPVESAETAMEPLGLPGEVEPTYRTVVKPEIPEPNAEGDTSKSISIDRTLGQCDQLGDQAETPATADPWVNQIDTVQRVWTWNGMDDSQIGLYLNTEGHQDENNRPGPNLYLSDGRVGIFTDKDDDGVYDQAGEEDLFTGIDRVGAYPMFWDMHLDEDLQPSGGCQAEFAQAPLAEAMAQAGYGPRTGLIEAIYLKEPTAIYDRRTNDIHTFLDGETVFVAKSQAIKALEAADDPTVIGLIHETVEATGAPAEADMVDLHDVKPQASDFWEQCGEPTGRYVQELQFLHDCTTGCDGDTVVTTYVFEVTSTDGVLGDGTIPAFKPDGQTPYSFGTGVHTWTDVDPFDNDPDRTTQDGTPPH